MNDSNKSSRPKRTDDKSDVSKLLGDGVQFRGKLIGMEEVTSARGDKMCQIAMAKAKAACKIMGDHKRKIIIHVSKEGVKMFDEKTEELISIHRIERISFLSRDAGDCRAFGYVYGLPNERHKFYAIKTEKTSEGIMLCFRDLFDHLSQLKLQNSQTLPVSITAINQSSEMINTSNSSSWLKFTKLSSLISGSSSGSTKNIYSDLSTSLATLPTSSKTLDTRKSPFEITRKFMGNKLSSPFSMRQFSMPNSSSRSNNQSDLKPIQIGQSEEDIHLNSIDISNQNLNAIDANPPYDEENIGWANFDQEPTFLEVTDWSSRDNFEDNNLPFVSDQIKKQNLTAVYASPHKEISNSLEILSSPSNNNKQLNLKNNLSHGDLIKIQQRQRPRLASPEIFTDEDDPFDTLADLTPMSSNSASLSFPSPDIPPPPLPETIISTFSRPPTPPPRPIIADTTSSKIEEPLYGNLPFQIENNNKVYNSSELSNQQNKKQSHSEKFNYISPWQTRIRNELKEGNGTNVNKNIYNTDIKESVVLNNVKTGIDRLYLDDPFAVELKNNRLVMPDQSFKVARPKGRVKEIETIGSSVDVESSSVDPFRDKDPFEILDIDPFGLVSPSSDPFSEDIPSDNISFQTRAVTIDHFDVHERNQNLENSPVIDTMSLGFIKVSSSQNYFSPSRIPPRRTLPLSNIMDVNLKNDRPQFIERKNTLGKQIYVTQDDNKKYENLFPVEKFFI